MSSKRSKDICKMIDGDKGVIKFALDSENAYSRMDAILWTAYHGFLDNDIVERIIRLKADNEIKMGYSVGNYAVAALNILGIERYCGEDVLQKELNSCFLPTKEDAEKAYKANMN